jgi:hypothetical protein
VGNIARKDVVIDAQRVASTHSLVTLFVFGTVYRNFPDKDPVAVPAVTRSSRSALRQELSFF